MLLDTVDPTIFMNDSSYNNNLSDPVALIVLDEPNNPSSDAGSDSEEETVEDVSVWISWNSNV